LEASPFYLGKHDIFLQFAKLYHCTLSSILSKDSFIVNGSAEIIVGSFHRTAYREKGLLNQWKSVTVAICKIAYEKVMEIQARGAP